MVKYLYAELLPASLVLGCVMVDSFESVLQEVDTRVTYSNWLYIHFLRQSNIPSSNHLPFILKSWALFVYIPHIHSQGAWSAVQL